MTPVDPPDALEIAAGVPLEPYDGRRCDPPPRHGPAARDVLERLVLGALSAGRTGVSFSGGRDSSLVLAVACHVARREGLPLPVAVTMRHPSADSQEDHWQEQVVRHLGVKDWIRVELGSSLDALGPVSTDWLRRGGVRMPPNAYMHRPVIEALGEGTVLTGVGGDEVLGTPASRLACVLQGRLRPRPRDLLSALLAAAPFEARRRRARRAGYPWAPWLTPEARARVVDRLAADVARPRIRWDWAAARWARSRTVGLSRHALQSLAEEHGARVLSPLTEVDFVDAFAREVGACGPADRTAAMRHLAGDLLPAPVLVRGSKARFDGVVWGPEFRAFVETWTPDELSPELRAHVDAERLIQAWSQPSPAYCSMALVQRVWCDRVLVSA